ncbi:uncharacterized protein PHACADRAFT_141944 [Phanerochaete carnosa HHB-10118-sp]|uniref:BIR-domain-containing protein n=1 Tax=Phanerochaete carnosa (strain HHB-10118-sp) TaxID=650164 RepID=K5V2Z1_PHACS|nr:uncharacterized protein PHACADRAFT_141944 [Phanerochaete carnosa HHB-10118-sp]EKM56921.1 hypothetical protein PHACADRAFT_141944 [Phanerochaete carnosa HHB-10118-sp]
MESWQSRFDSFNKGKRVKKGSSSTTLRWPHPSLFLANPETLAEAGFYFTPSVGNLDAVTCFICRKELSDWEEGDDPFAEHVRRGSSCCWAIARCGLRDDMDEDGNFVFPDPARLPSSKLMEKARADSYGANWPHDTVKGHGANSKKMAKAGFIYSPQGPEDDTATCFYCGTSLSGWDEGDDPLEEHRKREAKAGQPCPFLASAQPKPVGRPPTRTQTKPSSKQTTASKKKMPTLQQEDEDSPLSSDDPLTPATTSKSRASTASKTRTSSVPAKTPAQSLRKSTRSSTATKSSSRGTAGSENEDNASGSEVGKRVSKTKRKGDKEKESNRIEVIQEEEEGDLGGFDTVMEQEQEPVPAPKKRGRPPKKAAAAKPARKTLAEEQPEDEQPEDEEENEPAERATHGGTRSKTKANVEDEIDLLAESSSKSKSSTRPKTRSAPAADNSMPPPPVPPKRASSSRSASRHVAPVEEPEPGLEPKSKRTLMSKVKGKANSRMEESDDELAASLEDDESIPAPKKPKQSPIARPLTTTNGTPARQPGMDQPKARYRNSSSTSDDAGYATAEVLEPGTMQVDPEPDGVQLAEGTRKRSSSSLKQSETRDTTAARPNGASSDQLTRGSSVDNRRPTSRAGSVRPFARSSSRPAGSLAIRPSSKMGNEIVDISDSDDESFVKVASKLLKTTNGVVKVERDEAMAVDEPEAAKSIPVPQPFAQQKLPSKARQSKATGKLPKFQVEIVVPPPPTSTPPVQSDVEMGDDVATVQREPSPPQPVVEEPVTGQPAESALGKRTSPATPPPRTPSLPPTDTEAPKPKNNAPALPSFDEDIEAEAKAVRQPALSQTDGEDTFTSFTPLLSMLSLQRITSLTEEECDMTLEQYIRREIEREYEQLKADGERRIALFREKATEARRAIESA